MRARQEKALIWRVKGLQRDGPDCWAHGYGTSSAHCDETGKVAHSPLTPRPGWWWGRGCRQFSLQKQPSGYVAKHHGPLFHLLWIKMMTLSQKMEESVHSCGLKRVVASLYQEGSTIPGPPSYKSGSELGGEGITEPHTFPPVGTTHIPNCYVVSSLRATWCSTWVNNLE